MTSELSENYQRNFYPQSNFELNIFAYSLLSLFSCKSNEGISIDFEQLEFHFDKNLTILKSFERDWNQISSLTQQIGTTSLILILAFLPFILLIEHGTLNENSSIDNCKTDLISAKKVLQNRIEYDQIAKEILTLQSRPELLK